MKKIGRNDPCPCGSGKKYKQCCQQHEEAPAVKTHAVDPSIQKAIQAALEHHQAGHLHQAEAVYRQVLQRVPNHPDALHFLGVIAYHRGENTNAVELISKAIDASPSSLMHYNLGIALHAQGKLAAAIESYQKALLLKPNYVEAHTNLGNVFQAQGNLDAAVWSYQKALAIKSDDAGTHNSLGNVLHAQGELEAAVKSYQRACTLKPDFAEAHYNLGVALQAQDKPDAAVESYRKTLALRPDYAEAHNNMGSVLQSLEEAVEHYRKALALKPDYAGAYHNLGLALREQGKLDEAVACYQNALLIQPDYADAYSKLLFLHGYHASLDPHKYLSLARGWEQACLSEHERQAACGRVFQRLPIEGRRLKVGYVSGDYRLHAVSYFVEQLFTHHDRTRIELFAYSTNSHRDAVTERLQASVEHWVSLAGVSDAAAMERIEADGIDVLIDLSGHTTDNRLKMFARRTAPVQAYYLGYFASTGLTEMDYWIGDEALTPPETDSHFNEQVWRLPRISWSYDGKDAPSPAWQPDPDGILWIGSFSSFGKLTPETLILWAKVLNALPEGRLLLKTRGLANAGNRQPILDVMTSHSILPERIELQDINVTPDWRAHMDYYNRLDIVLDPVGAMGGVTTTCDALWMAAPVIAMQGDRVASRATASMLDAIDHPEWIARTEAEYVDKIVALARDVEQRNSLRSSQRSRMARSPLCDARGLSMALEDAYFKMFERWLEGQNG